MDVYVKGVVIPTEEYKKKVAAYNACVEAGILIPDELDRYFNFEKPDKEGMTIEIEEAVSGDVMEDDCEMWIDLSKLPPNVTHIKVVGSY